jgi:hypothetical protein
MPVWRTAPVSDEPEIALVQWTVFETDNGQRHLVGARQDGLGGRVSSAVVELNVAARTGVTRSGRKYLLVGAPGFHLDAAYVWDAWMRLNEVVSARNVTPDLFDGVDFD